MVPRPLNTRRLFILSLQPFAHCLRPFVAKSQLAPAPHRAVPAPIYARGRYRTSRSARVGRYQHPVRAGNVSSLGGLVVEYPASVPDIISSTIFDVSTGHLVC
eukprot:2529110-Rhodomonas_salina.2